ncbi:NTP pyrophosphatase (non-canonical NTP hydrolase) [Bradyrhizobium liaoningense]
MTARRDLVGGLQRGAVGRLAHVHVPDDVLDLDDGIVDENAGRQRDGEKADEVQREAEQVHRPERREDRQRQRDRGDDGRAQVAQEQQHDDDGEDGAFEQGRDRRVVVAVGVFDRGVDHLQIDVGIGRLERVDALLHGFGDLHVAGALGTLDAERNHRLAIEAGEGAAVGDGVGDGAEIVEPDLAAAEQRDHGAGEIAQRLGARERSDRLVVLADLGAAAGDVDIGAAQALADIDGSQAHGLQAIGIERDQDLALDTADALDLRDAAHALKRALDHVVDEIGELLRRLAGRDRGIGDDRQADDVDALDQRLGDVLRQVGAHARHRVLDVVERAVGVGLERELDRGDRQAVGDRGGDVPDALDAGDRVFNRLGDLGFELGWRCAKLRDRNRDHRDVGRGQPRHRKLGEGGPAENQEDD